MNLLPSESRIDQSLRLYLWLSFLVYTYVVILSYARFTIVAVVSEKGGEEKIHIDQNSDECLRMLEVHGFVGFILFLLTIQGLFRRVFLLSAVSIATYFLVDAHRIIMGYNPTPIGDISGNSSCYCFWPLNFISGMYFILVIFSLVIMSGIGFHRMRRDRNIWYST